MTIVLTGADGRIGAVLRAGLAAAGHEVVSTDRLLAPPGHQGEWHPVDLTRRDEVDALFAAVRPAGVVHCAGTAGERTLAESLTAHPIATAAVLEAMRSVGANRLVYMSSNHVVGLVPRADYQDGRRVPADATPRPDTYYGVAKAATEALLRLWAERTDLDVVTCRIGSCTSEPRSVRALATWLSHGDLVRMVDAALRPPASGYTSINGISDNTRAWWDLDAGRRIGYEPLDDAEPWAPALLDAGPEPEGLDLLGGSFADGPLRGPWDERER